MTESEIIKQLFLSFAVKDDEMFLSTAREYIDREKRKKHNALAIELEKALFSSNMVSGRTEKRFKNNLPIPRDSEKGFPLLEIQSYQLDFENLILSSDVKEQLNRIIQEFKDSDVLSTYNLSYKKKIFIMW